MATAQATCRSSRCVLLRHDATVCFARVVLPRKPRAVRPVPSYPPPEAPASYCRTESLFTRRSAAFQRRLRRTDTPARSVLWVTPPSRTARGGRPPPTIPSDGVRVGGGSPRRSRYRRRASLRSRQFSPAAVIESMCIHLRKSMTAAGV